MLTRFPSGGFGRGTSAGENTGGSGGGMPSWHSAIAAGNVGTITGSTASGSAALWGGANPGGSEGGDSTAPFYDWASMVVNQTGLVKAGDSTLTAGTFLEFHAGGHGNYAGNQIMAIGPLENNSVPVLRITDPTIPAPTNVARAGDGSPVASHMYAVPAWLKSINSFLRVTCAQYSNGFSSPTVDLFDHTVTPGASAWSACDTGRSAAWAFDLYDGAGDYDEVNDEYWVIWTGNTRKFTRLKPVTKVWTDYSVNNPTYASRAPAAIDSGRRLFVKLTSTGVVQCIDIAATIANGSAATIFTPTVTGTGPGTLSEGGLTFDDDNHVFRAWPGSGNVFYTLTPGANPSTDAWTWTSYTAGGSSVPTTYPGSTGLTGRFRHIKKFGGCVIASDRSQPVHFWKYP